jgi:hypothetical protein
MVLIHVIFVLLLVVYVSIYDLIWLGSCIDEYSRFTAAYIELREKTEAGSLSLSCLIFLVTGFD